MRVSGELERKMKDRTECMDWGKCLWGGSVQDTGCILRINRWT